MINRVSASYSRTMHFSIIGAESSDVVTERHIVELSQVVSDVW